MFTIREAIKKDASGIAAVHVESWQTTYKGIIPQHFLDELSVEERTKLWNQNLENRENMIFVAEDSSGIIGFITGGKRKENTEVGATDLTSLYLLDACHGQGIGRKLVDKLMHAFKKQGYKKVYVDVLADNATRHFYTYLGADYVKTVKVRIGGRLLNEEVYVFEIN